MKSFKDIAMNFVGGSLIAAIFIVVALLFATSYLVQASPSETTLRPDAVGTYQEWETVVDTTHYGATSDSNDATYIETTGDTNQRDIQALHNVLNNQPSNIRQCVHAVV